METQDNTSSAFEDEYDLDDRYEQLANDAYHRNHGRMVNQVNRTRGSQPSRKEILQNLVEDNDLIEDFVPTYAAKLDPKHFERRWVIGSLSGFWRDKIISDVLYQVKVGKEANVYACEATESSEHDLIAAKLYRPRMLRHLRNDAAYKIGRLSHDREGKKMKQSSRAQRALKKKTKFGQDLDFSNWVGHEYRMQTELWEAGANVPQPIAHSGTTILMAFCGNRSIAAATLNDVILESAEAQPLFDKVIDNVRLMLSLNQVHGDLSAYNILYWQGEVTIIDFPQMVNAAGNPNSERFLRRDIQRVVDYFSQYGVKADGGEIAQTLWKDFMNAQL